MSGPDAPIDADPGIDATGSAGLRPQFWEKLSLEELRPGEWEALCDGCARCCMIKLQDESTDEIVHTAVVCKLLDLDSCRCTAYAQRHTLVPDCIDFSADLVQQLAWLPLSCAYRRIADGRGLAHWHPLVSGNPASVHDFGISVRDRVVSESAVPEDALQDMVVHWVEC